MYTNTLPSMQHTYPQTNLTIDKQNRYIPMITRLVGRSRAFRHTKSRLVVQPLSKRWSCVFIHTELVAQAWKIPTQKLYTKRKLVITLSGNPISTLLNPFYKHLQKKKITRLFILLRTTHFIYIHTCVYVFIIVS